MKRKYQHSLGDWNYVTSDGGKLCIRRYDDDARSNGGFRRIAHLNPGAGSGYIPEDYANARAIEGVPDMIDLLERCEQLLLALNPTVGPDVLLNDVRNFLNTLGELELPEKVQEYRWLVTVKLKGEPAQEQSFLTYEAAQKSISVLDGEKVESVQFEQLED